MSPYVSEAYFAHILMGSALINKPFNTSDFRAINSEPIEPFSIIKQFSPISMFQAAALQAPGKAQSTNSFFSFQ